KAKSLKKALGQEDALKEYLAYEKAISESEELAALRDQIEAKQREMVQKATDQEAYQKVKNEYTSLMDRYRNDPLVLNRNAAKVEAEALLQKVAEELS
ncbi:MAG: YlbF family regulator, partial [Bacilli bacterium]|nr:YlbF family regulator [Bacilli bacterium]